jgi:uncharacterized protein YcbK (DUF882 family)
MAAVIAVIGLALVSGTPYSRAADISQAHKTLEPSATNVELGGAAHVVDSFTLVSANTLERVEVRYVDGVVDETSRQQVDHLMRCLRTDSAKRMDTRLIDTLREIAKEVDAPLELVSGYRAPQNWRDHNFHSRGQAADIRVKGIGASKLRKIARKLGVRGVGWYPTTNMIHVDTRDEDWFWTDWSGPGQIGREIPSR